MQQKTTHYACRPKNCKIEYIVIHYPAMPDRNALAVEKYFTGTKKDVSTHYIVDENRVISLLDCSYRAYHVGSLRSHELVCEKFALQCKKPPRAWMCENANSIGIDICDHKKNLSSYKAEDRDWFFSDAAINRAAELVADIMRIHNISLSNVVRHYDVTGKLCPRPFVGSDINEVTGISGNESWFRFLDQVKHIKKD